MYNVSCLLKLVAKYFDWLADGLGLGHSVRQLAAEEERMELCLLGGWHLVHP
jgi:hypothetical protein